MTLHNLQNKAKVQKALMEGVPPASHPGRSWWRIILSSIRKWRQKEPAIVHVITLLSLTHIKRMFTVVTGFTHLLLYKLPAHKTSKLCSKIACERPRVFVSGFVVVEWGGCVFSFSLVDVIYCLLTYSLWNN